MLVVALSPQSAWGQTGSSVWCLMDFVSLLHSSLQECVVFSVGAWVHCAAGDFSVRNVGST